MNELKMIKAFAELEGIAFSDSYASTEGDACLWAEIYGDGCYGWYKPIADLTSTFKAMIKYKVSVEYGENSYFICINGGSYTEVMDEDVIPHAIFECILKSKGLWCD